MEKFSYSYIAKNFLTAIVAFRKYIKYTKWVNNKSFNDVGKEEIGFFFLTEVFNSNILITNFIIQPKDRNTSFSLLIFKRIIILNEEKYLQIG